MKVLGIARKNGSDTLLLNVGNDPCDAFVVRVRPDHAHIQVGDPVLVKGDGLIWVKGIPMKMADL